MKLKSWHLYFAVICFIALSLISGSYKSAGQALAIENSEVDEILEAMPEDIPENFSDEDIDELMKDIDNVDEEADTARKEDAEAPDTTDEDRDIAEKIKKNPEDYHSWLRDELWLARHYTVVWLLLSDYEWVMAHPRTAIILYVNYRYWQQYPQIAYVIVTNRPFLAYYPRVCLMVYRHDTWFLAHPFIACEIYLHHVFFVKYPSAARRYYRHHAWIHRHPRVARAAYGNRDLLRNYPAYTRNAYQYRRQAVKSRQIHQERLHYMHQRRDHYRQWRENKGGGKSGQVSGTKARPRDTRSDRGVREKTGKGTGQKDRVDRDRSTGAKTVRDRSTDERTGGGRATGSQSTGQKPAVGKSRSGDGTGRGRVKTGGSKPSTGPAYRDRQGHGSGGSVKLKPQEGGDQGKSSGSGSDRKGKKR